MEIYGKLNYLRIAPRKVRLVIDLIRGMDVKQAKTQLSFMPQRVAKHLIKLINSVVSNAENNFKIKSEGLFIKEIKVDEGTPFKRWRPVSRGRAFPIMKRTSNITLVLETKEGMSEKTVELKPEVKQEVKQEEKTEEKKEKSVSLEKSKMKAPKKIKKASKIQGLTKKIFRRKAF